MLKQLRVQRDRLALPVLVLLQIKAVIAPPAPSGHPLGAAAAPVGGAAPLKHLSVKEQKQHLAGGRSAVRMRRARARRFNRGAAALRVSGLQRSAERRRRERH
ncbi:hypothetical protein MHYP_G00334200 [Metynnis hypsauchen]